VVVQPDLARRLMLPQTPNFQQRHALHQEQVLKVLQTVVTAPGFGLHTLVVAEWDGAGSLKLLAVQGRTPQLPLEAGDETLLGVAMAQVMGHVALGHSESEQPSALAIDPAQLPAGSTVMVCPISCAVTNGGQGVLLAIHEPVGGQASPVGAQALALGGLQAVVAAAGIAQQAPLQGLHVIDAAHPPSTSRFQQPLAEQGIEVRAAAGDHVHGCVDAALAEGAQGA
jgi:hypothetical protein